MVFEFEFCLEYLLNFSPLLFVELTTHQRLDTLDYDYEMNA